MFFFIIGFVLLYFLLQQIQLSELYHLILTVQPQYLLLGALVYLCKASIRAIRLLRINNLPNKDWIRAFRLTLATSLASQVFPFKLGEFTYIYLLKKDQRLSVTEGISSLLVTRIWDMMAISVLFVAFTIFIGFFPTMSVYFYAILIFLCALLFCTIALIALSHSATRFVHYSELLKTRIPIPIFIRILEGIRRVIHILGGYRLREYGEWIVWALLEWGINYIAYHILMLGIGLNPSFFATVTAVSFAALANVLPINSFGSFGIQEAGWATGLVALGYQQTVAITSGFATHLLTLMFIAISGVVAWFTYSFDKNEKNPL